MKVSNIQKYLLTRFSTGGIIVALLFTLSFFIYYNLDNSLQKNNLILENISSIENSIYQIKNDFQLYVKANKITERNTLKRKLDLQFADLRNNSEIKEISFDESINSIQPFKSKLNSLKRELQSITVVYRTLSAEENKKSQKQYFGLIIEHITNIHYLLNQLSMVVTSHQQKLVSDFSKYNILIWLAALLSLHLIIIFIFKPTTLKIISEIDDLNKEKDEAYAIASAKSDYLASLSYQIRTPLNGVLGLSGLLLETNINKEQREYLELVKDSGENLLQVINNIFDYSKIETSNFELEENYFSLHQCVEDIIKIFLPRCQEKKLDLVHIIEHDVPEYIFGDSIRLTQCLSNLLSNAIKFTREGEIFIRINLLNSFDNKHEIQFAVSDTGMGIPEAKINTLFSPMLKSEAPVARRFEGTGLGLAIVSRIVQIMNGRIWIESEISKGTTFYIAINFLGKKAGVDLKNEKDTKLLYQKHIIILDNSESIRKNLSIQCHNWGMQPRVLDSYNDFINIINNQLHVDYFLFTFEFINDHFEILNKIRSIQAYKNTPIIYTHSLEVESLKKADLVFLKKPVVKANLLDIFFLNATSQNIESIPEDENPKKIGKLKLLLAEDNLINQKLMERMVFQLGYKLDLALDGNQAIEMATKNNYDVIFMDLQMPEIDGLEATKRILNNAKEPKPKIVAMTANVLQKDKELCFEAGMIDYLVKPIGFESIKNILNYWSKAKHVEMI